MSHQTRTVIRLVERARARTWGELRVRWGSLVLPARVDEKLVYRVGGFIPGSRLGSVILSRSWEDLPRGTTLVRGSTPAGDMALVAIFEAA
jgi:hypothetical protein